MGYSIANEKRGLCITYSGLVGFADFMGAVLTIHKDPLYQSYKYVIHDMSPAQELDFSQVDLTQIVAQELGARYNNPKIKACVISGSPEMGELVRAFSSLTGLEVGLFSGMADARAWCQ